MIIIIIIQIPCKQKKFSLINSEIIVCLEKTICKWVIMPNFTVTTTHLLITG